MFKLTTDLAKSGDSCRNKTLKKKKKNIVKKAVRLFTLKWFALVSFGKIALA